MRLACANCSWKGPEERAKEAQDLTMRHEVGSLYSDRECPKCGALCFPTDRTKAYPFSRFVTCKSLKEQHVAQKALRLFRLGGGA